MKVLQLALGLQLLLSASALNLENLKKALKSENASNYSITNNELKLLKKVIPTMKSHLAPVNINTDDDDTLISTIVDAFAAAISTAEGEAKHCTSLPQILVDYFLTPKQDKCKDQHFIVYVINTHLSSQRLHDIPAAFTLNQFNNEIRNYADNELDAYYFFLSSKILTLFATFGPSLSVEKYLLDPSNQIFNKVKEGKERLEHLIFGPAYPNSYSEILSSPYITYKELWGSEENYKTFKSAFYATLFHIYYADNAVSKLALGQSGFLSSSPKRTLQQLTEEITQSTNPIIEKSNPLIALISEKQRASNDPSEQRILSKVLSKLISYSRYEYIYGVLANMCFFHKVTSFYEVSKYFGEDGRSGKPIHLPVLTESSAFPPAVVAEDLIHMLITISRKENNLSVFINPVELGMSFTRQEKTVIKSKYYLSNNYKKRLLQNRNIAQEGAKTIFEINPSNFPLHKISQNVLTSEEMKAIQFQQPHEESTLRVMLNGMQQTNPNNQRSEKSNLEKLAVSNKATVLPTEESTFGTKGGKNPNETRKPLYNSNIQERTANVEKDLSVAEEHFNYHLEKNEKLRNMSGETNQNKEDQSQNTGKGTKLTPGQKNASVKTESLSSTINKPFSFPQTQVKKQDSSLTSFRIGSAKPKATDEDRLSQLDESRRKPRIPVTTSSERLQYAYRGMSFSPPPKIKKKTEQPSDGKPKIPNNTKKINTLKSIYDPPKKEMKKPQNSVRSTSQRSIVEGEANQLSENQLMRPLKPPQKKKPQSPLVNPILSSSAAASKLHEKSSQKSLSMERDNLQSGNPLLESATESSNALSKSSYIQHNTAFDKGNALKSAKSLDGGTTGPILSKTPLNSINNVAKSDSLGTNKKSNNDMTSHEEQLKYNVGAIGLIDISTKKVGIVEDDLHEKSKLTQNNIRNKEERISQGNDYERDNNKIKVNNSDTKVESADLKSPNMSDKTAKTNPLDKFGNWKKKPLEKSPTSLAIDKNSKSSQTRIENIQHSQVGYDTNPLNNHARLPSELERTDAQKNHGQNANKEVASSPVVSNTSPTNTNTPPINNAPNLAKDTQSSSNGMIENKVTTSQYEIMQKKQLKGDAASASITADNMGDSKTSVFQRFINWVNPFSSSKKKAENEGVDLSQEKQDALSTNHRLSDFVEAKELQKIVQPAINLSGQMSTNKEDENFAEKQANIKKGTQKSIDKKDEAVIYNEFASQALAQNNLSHDLNKERNFEGIDNHLNADPSYDTENLLKARNMKIDKRDQPALPKATGNLNTEHLDKIASNNSFVLETKNPLDSLNNSKEISKSTLNVNTDAEYKSPASINSAQSKGNDSSNMIEQSGLKKNDNTNTEESFDSDDANPLAHYVLPKGLARDPATTDVVIYALTDNEDSRLSIDPQKVNLVTSLQNGSSATQGGNEDSDSKKASQNSPSYNDPNPEAEKPATSHPVRRGILRKTTILSGVNNEKSKSKDLLIEAYTDATSKKGSSIRSTPNAFIRTNQITNWPADNEAETSALKSIPSKSRKKVTFKEDSLQQTTSQKEGTQTQKKTREDKLDNRKVSFAEDPKENDAINPGSTISVRFSYQQEQLASGNNDPNSISSSGGRGKKHSNGKGTKTTLKDMEDALDKSKASTHLTDEVQPSQSTTLSQETLRSSGSSPAETSKNTLRESNQTEGTALKTSNDSSLKKHNSQSADAKTTDSAINGHQVKATSAGAKRSTNSVLADKSHAKIDTSQNASFGLNSKGTHNPDPNDFFQEDLDELEKKRTAGQLESDYDSASTAANSLVDVDEKPSPKKAAFKKSPISIKDRFLVYLITLGYSAVVGAITTVAVYYYYHYSVPKLDIRESHAYNARDSYEQ